jgi:ATP-dependent Zn protease
MIRESMGGRAAEIIYYGEEGGLSSGVSGDLQHASHWARLMVQEFAMAREIGNIAYEKEALRDGPLAVTVSQVAEKIVTEELHKAKKLLNDHRIELDNLIDRLVERNRLTRDEMASILGAADK